MGHSSFKSVFTLPVCSLVLSEKDRSVVESDHSGYVCRVFISGSSLHKNKKKDDWFSNMFIKVIKIIINNDSGSTFVILKKHNLLFLRDI